MKKVFAIVALMLFVAATGCQMGSHLELGAVYTSSEVSVHEWKEPAFNSEQTEDGFKLSSTLGVMSSELTGKVKECEGLSAGGYITWKK